MTSKKIDGVDRTGFKSGDSIAMTIPKGWRALIGMKDKDGEEDLKLKLDLMFSEKYGHYVAVYGLHQKKEVLLKNR